MARIEHRRYRRIRASEGGSPAAGELRRDPSPARRDEEPGAPDAWLDDLVAKLTWLGWLSLAGAAAYLVLNLGFLLDDGVLSGGRLLGTVPATLRVAGFGAMLALPAALELGGAGARVAVPRLMRGAVLLATAELVRLVVAEIQHRAFESDALALDPFDFENPVRLAFQMLGTVARIVMIAGAWSLSVGL